MNKKLIIDRVINLMKDRKISRKSLADFLGVTPNAITEWTSGRNSSYMKHLPELSEFFGISLDELTTERSANIIPVFGSVAAGIPIEAITDIEDYEEITPAMKNSGEYFALTIHGDSMQPRMYNGDRVIVRLQPDCESGDIAIVMVNGCDATCKKIEKTSDGIRLISLNPTYQPMCYSKHDIATLPITILGIVVELRAKI